MADCPASTTCGTVLPFMPYGDGIRRVSTSDPSCLYWPLTWAMSPSIPLNTTCRSLRYWPRRRAIALRRTIAPSSPPGPNEKERRHEHCLSQHPSAVAAPVLQRLSAHHPWREPQHDSELSRYHGPVAALCGSNQTTRPGSPRSERPSPRRCAGVSHVFGERPPQPALHPQCARRRDPCLFSPCGDPVPRAPRTGSTHSEYPPETGANATH